MAACTWRGDRAEIERRSCAIEAVDVGHGEGRARERGVEGALSASASSRCFLAVASGKVFNFRAA